jgi:hypothetical protein
MGSTRISPERRAEQNRLRHDVWSEFSDQLRRAETLEDALRLYASAVKPDTPGRSYYSNFGFFLQTFAPPAGASVYELQQYLRLLRCFDNQGIVKGGAMANLVPVLERAITDRE